MPVKIPVYQIGVAVHLLIAISMIILVFAGPRVSC